MRQETIQNFAYRSVNVRDNSPQLMHSDMASKVFGVSNKQISYNNSVKVLKNLPSTAKGKTVRSVYLKFQELLTKHIGGSDPQAQKQKKLNNKVFDWNRRQINVDPHRLPSLEIREDASRNVSNLKQNTSSTGELPRATKLISPNSYQVLPPAPFSGDLRIKKLLRKTNNQKKGQVKIDRPAIPRWESKDKSKAGSTPSSISSAFAFSNIPDISTQGFKNVEEKTTLFLYTDNA